MKKLIRLTEGDLHRIIENTVQKILREAFDPTLIDGVDSIDMRSFRQYLMDFFGNYRARKTPYYGVKELIHYFFDSNELGRNKKPIQATYKKVRGGGRIYRAIKRNDVLDSLITKMKKLDDKLTETALHANGSQRQIMQQIVWDIDEMSKILGQIFQNKDLREILDHYASDAGAFGMAGDAEGGKQKGLGRMMFEAGQGLNNVKQQIMKLYKIVEKGNVGTTNSRIR